MSIKCKSITNLMPTMCQWIHCQSYATLVTFLYKFIAKPLPMLHYWSIANQYQSSFNMVPIGHQIGVNRGIELASIDALCARCFTFYIDVAVFEKHCQIIASVSQRHSVLHDFLGSIQSFVIVLIIQFLHPWVFLNIVINI